ncbi:hypothetical protein [Cupriavidus sp. RAF12]|uniref:hypothetical protein n=1 Tax=Cupriavidus sp. RAF12 TaxID=3233050 RepID=UPI003F8F3CBD
MWHQAGEDVTINVDFLVQGVPAVPDTDTVAYTVFGNDGQALPDLTSLPLTVTGTSAEIAVPAAQNALGTLGAEQEARYVRVNYRVEGKAYVARVTYRLHPFVPMEASPDSVRNALGVAPNELPDEDIDLVASYLAIKADYPDAVAALTATTVASLAANRVITLHAAIQALPSLRLRLPQVDRTENSTFQRFNGKWDELRAELEAQLQDQLVLASPTAATTAGTLQPVFSVSTPTDPVTNA